MAKPAWLRKRTKQIKKQKEERERKTYERERPLIVTEGEKELSKALEKAGVGHKTQAVVGPYTVDIKIGRVIVQVEGRSHFLPDVAKHDAERRAYLERKGYKIIRISEGVARNDSEGTAKTIKNMLKRP